MNRLPRWRGAVGGSLILALVGIALGVETVLLVALVALGVVAVASGASTPPDAVRVERRLDDDRPSPGAPVTVTLTVRNPTDRVLADVRVVDDVPEAVAVVGGTPAFATALGPGESAAHTYDIAPPRGEFSFGEVTVRQRNLPGTVSRTEWVTAEGLTEFTCETLLDHVPLRDRTIRYVGQTPTDDGGTGVEFYAVREYRPGDPMSRIDWHRLARTGTLSTVEYREERAVDVVFVVDDRDGVHVDSLDGGPDSFDLTLYAASRGVVRSIDEGNRTGVATLAGDWVSPGSDAGTRERAAEALAGASRTAARSLTDGGTAGDLLEYLPANAQVVFCSPLTDDGVIDFADRLASRGHGLSVVSPDMTTGIGDVDSTVGTRAAALRRRSRVAELRGLDVHVADWDLSEPIVVELKRLGRRRRYA